LINPNFLKEPEKFPGLILDEFSSLFVSDKVALDSNSILFSIITSDEYKEAIAAALSKIEERLERMRQDYVRQATVNTIRDILEKNLSKELLQELAQILASASE
jgi:hypothetical protein